MLDGLVDTFGLTVGFGVECCGEVWADVQGGCEGAPPGGGERRATVGNDIGRNTVKTENIIEELLSEVGRVIGFTCRDEVGHLGQAVDDYENSVFTVACW